MRVTPRKNKKKLMITTLVVLALVVAGLLWYFAFFTSRSADGGKESVASTKETDTKSQGDNSDDKSSDTSTNTKNQSVSHEAEKDLPQLYEGENASSSSSLSGAITSKSVTEDTLIIRSTINQLVSGTCTLTMTSGGKTVTKTAEVIQNPSTSSCAGFDVPVSELGSGQWSIDIKVTSGDKSMNLTDKVDI